MQAGLRTSNAGTTRLVITGRPVKNRFNRGHRHAFGEAAARRHDYRVTPGAEVALVLRRSPTMKANNGFQPKFPLAAPEAFKGRAVSTDVPADLVWRPVLDFPSNFENVEDPFAGIDPS